MKSPQLSRAEQLRLISELTENLRVEAPPEGRTSILDLQGLGKEIWQGADAQDYLIQETESMSMTVRGNPSLLSEVKREMGRQAA